MKGAIPGQYIVSLASGVSPSAMADRVGIRPMFTYTRVHHGFAAKLTTAQVDMLRNQPGVSAVEQDARLDVPRVTGPATTRPARKPVAATPRRQAAPVPWGLARINHRENGATGYAMKATGAKVNSYIIDTGIQLNHPDFGGRAVAGHSFIDDGRGTRDCNGHGTHVAGTVGGTTSGVAKKTRLVSVRVFDCSGVSANSTVIAAANWVAANAKKPAVANLSLGGPYSAAMNRALEGLAAAGVFPVVAAGNENSDACATSPASSPGALTVAATDQKDRKAPFSNWGRCVDINAPGVDIRSAYLGGTFRELSGSSMAAPHVTGVAALYKDTYGDASFKSVASWLIGYATPGVDTSNKGVPTGTPPRLVYTGRM
ncbi:S8 family peptidase [Streptomyces sp. XD-27]|uniref:S8 family peptidase n=1 Tax=Streptomyces sp. XD-27 TaxID=3062779 RepID=UPI0026F46A99|nr:S8 family peptidase [Streptomyces sp. XD-27]WKX70168.1 S8 family peptidase [Streptomyces sp. XD-27]